MRVRYTDRSSRVLVRPQVDDEKSVFTLRAVCLCVMLAVKKPKRNSFFYCSAAMESFPDGLARCTAKVGGKHHKTTGTFFTRLKSHSHRVSVTLVKNVHTGSKFVIITKIKCSIYFRHLISLCLCLFYHTHFLTLKIAKQVAYKSLRLSFNIILTVLGFLGGGGGNQIKVGRISCLII